MEVSIEGIKGLSKAFWCRLPIIHDLRHTSKKRKIIFAIIILLVIAGIAYAVNMLFFGKIQVAEYTEYAVEQGNVTVSISGSGTVEPISQYEVVSQVDGEVLSDTFKEGDAVEKGQLLYNIDSSDMEKTMEKANITLEKSNMSYQNSLDSNKGLTVATPLAGRVTEILVNKGDNISSGTKIATIIDDTWMTVKIPFNENDVSGFYVGQSVNMTMENTFELLNGTISKIYKNKRVLDGYVTVTDVEVTVKNPGALTSGTYVTVNIGGIDSYNSATLECSNEQTITAKTSGMVSTLIATEGEYLNNGGAILKLSSDSAADDLRSSQLSLRETELSYESTLDQLDNYNIKAPISGSIISKSIKAGDTLDSSSAQMIMAVIADMSTMTFTIDVDELDIASMKEGQSANISIDALDNKKFTGYVDNIGLLGTSENGVTSYPVTIVINNGDELWPGMNATADIVINSVENVLIAPVSAVNRGNIVLVKGAEGTDGICLLYTSPSPRD